jgi:hypothetical protein
LAFTSSGGTGTKTYSLTPTISGITIDSSTGILTVASSVAANTYYESVVATDSFNVSGTLGITVLVDSAIAMTGPASLATTYGTLETSTAFSALYGTGTKTFSISPTGLGVSIDPSTGMVTISATAGNGSTVTSWVETITATDSVTATGVETVTITVNPTLMIGGGSQIKTTYSRADSSTAFTYSGGTGPWVFGITPVLTGITIDTVTGVVRASNTTPAGTFTETVTVTDAVGATAKTTTKITVAAALAITGGGDMYTTVGTADSTSAYAVSGGTGTKTLVLTTGTSGVTFDSGTYILYVDSTPGVGTYYETLTATDSLGVATIKVESITVNPLVVISGGSSLVTTFKTALSSTAFVATLGTGTKTWSLRGPPSGFTVNSSTGVVSMDTTVAIGSYSLTLRATDIVGSYTETTVAVTVNQSLTIDGGTSFIQTTRGLAAYTPGFQGHQGTGTLKYSISPTNTGITVDTNTGIVTIDSATAANTYNESITVTDAVGSSIKAALQIVVNPAIVVSGPSSIATTVTIPISTSAFTSQYGTGTRVLSMSGTSNAGITFNPSTGVISLDGTVQPGIYLETITSTDSLTVTGTKMITITVDSAIVVSAGSNINTTFGTPLNSSAFVATLGTGNKRFSLNPTYAGITIDSVTGIVSVTGSIGAFDTTTIFVETVIATDSVLAVGYKTETITVNPRIVITGGTPTITTTHGLAMYSQPYQATNGTSTLVFSLSPNYSSSGITIGQNGVVAVDSSTPAGTYYESITVTDSVSSVTKVSETIVVNPAITVTMTGVSSTGAIGGVVPLVDYSPSGITSSGLVDSQAHANSALYGNPTVSGGIITFNGSSQYSLTSTNLASTFPGASVSILARIYPTGNGVIVQEDGQQNISTNWHDSQIEMVSGTLKFSLWGYNVITSSIPTPFNNWYTVALTYDNSTHVMNAYVNGQLAGTKTGYTRSTGYGGNLYYSIAGADSTNLGDGGYGQFSLSQFDLYGVALTQSQVASYTGGAANAIATTVTIPLTSPAAAGNYGTGSLVLSMSPSNLQGITFNSSTGIISADSTTPVGTYYETITATDSLGVTGSSTYSIVVNPAITITNGSAINTTYGTALNSAAFTANYGTNTKRFSISPSVSGISIDTTSGIVSASNILGRSDTTSVWVETITATDTVGATGYTTITITVNPTIVISGGVSSITTTRGLGKQSPAFIATYGTTGETWTITPFVAGITIDTYTGVVKVDSATASGSGYTPAIYNETITATDSVGSTTKTTIQITVNHEVVVSGGSNINTTYGIPLSSAVFQSAYGT